MQKKTQGGGRCGGGGERGGVGWAVCLIFSCKCGSLSDFTKNFSKRFPPILSEVLQWGNNFPYLFSLLFKFLEVTTTTKEKGFGFSILKFCKEVILISLRFATT